MSSLKVKANIINNYIVVFGNDLEISEYFYYWRKFCEDFKYRLYYCEEYGEAIKRGKKLLKLA